MPNSEEPIPAVPNWAPPEPRMGCVQKRYSYVGLVGNIGICTVYIYIGFRV